MLLKQHNKSDDSSPIMLEAHNGVMLEACNGYLNTLAEGETEWRVPSERPEASPGGVVLSLSPSLIINDNSDSFMGIRY
ncbi:MAG: hypothetical protein PHU23_17685 [Dehalococcoidales bacterium]|nr:hypothetical protein [Dehalococcoidales bacterium]